MNSRKRPDVIEWVRSDEMRARGGKATGFSACYLLFTSHFVTLVITGLGFSLVVIMAETKGKFDFAIDRGGTFTDVFARLPDGRERVLKLLSRDPQNYKDAPTEGIRRVLEEVVESNVCTLNKIKKGINIYGIQPKYCLFNLPICLN